MNILNQSEFEQLENIIVLINLFKDKSLITFIGDILLKTSTVHVNELEKIIKFNHEVIVFNNSLGVAVNYKYTN